MEGAVVVGKLLERNAEADYGYNAATNTYQDLVKAGIIDPLKVYPPSSLALVKQCVTGPVALCTMSLCTMELLCRAKQPSVLLLHYSLLSKDSPNGL